MFTTTSLLVNSLGWGILHSVWQGAMIFGLLKLTQLSFPNMQARFKYLLAYLSLTAMFVWFIRTVYGQWEKLQAIVVKVTEAGQDPAGHRIFFVHTFPKHPEAFSSSFMHQAEKYFPWIIGLYAAGLCFLAIRLIVNLFQINILKKRGTLEPPRELLHAVERLSIQLNIERRVRLLITEKLNVPVMFGTLRPVILLPMASVTQLSPDQLEAILLHELAHIKRNDYLLNILQTIAETFMFFNPFTWFISGIIRREREHCCDDLVLSCTSQPLPYAKALAALEAQRLAQPALAMGATGSSNNLLHRIKRIMEMKKHQLNYGQLVLAIILTAVLGLSVIWFTPALAQDRKEKPKDRKEAPAAETEVAGTPPSPPAKTILIDDKGYRTEVESLDDLPDNIAAAVQEAMKASEIGMASAKEAMKIAQEALKGIDIPEITPEVQQAFANIDWNEIGTAMNKAMAEIDWNEINADVAEALREADSSIKDPEVRAAVREAVTKAQEQAMKAAEAGRLRAEQGRAKVEAARVKAESGRLRAETARSKAKDAHALADEARRRAEAQAREAEGSSGSGMPSASAGWGKNKVSSDDYNRMLDRMEADGLINRNKGFTIKKSDGRFTINGKKQDAGVYERYRRFLDHESVLIKGKKDDLTIQIKD